MHSSQIYLRSSVMSQVMIEQPPLGLDSSAPAKTSVTLSFRQINRKKKRKWLKSQGWHMIHKIHHRCLP